MSRTKMRRKHVPFFCERCGKEEFDGVVFGREVERQVRARSGDRMMLCNDCLPKEPNMSLQMFQVNPVWNWDPNE